MGRRRKADPLSSPPQGLENGHRLVYIAVSAKQGQLG